MKLYTRDTLMDSQVLDEWYSKKKRIHFMDSKGMLQFILDGQDLYSPGSMLYVFQYNDRGSICSYTLSISEAYDLDSKEEYWGAYLGFGGHIHDPERGEALNWCKENYKLHDWVIVTK